MFGAKHHSTACPICCNEIFNSFLNIKDGQRNSIREFTVFCTNEKKGCNWPCKVKTSMTSPITLETVTVVMNVWRCYNDDIWPAMLRMSANWVILSSVNDCHITEELKEQCPMLPLSCLNECEAGDIIYEDMEGVSSWDGTVWESQCGVWGEDDA